MSTKMTAAQQELYNQTIKQLDIIVLATPTINLLKSDTLFQGVVSECVGIVNYFETKYEIANGSTNRYTQAYFTICNKQLTFNDDPKLYKNITDLKDKVNYLNTYLINKIGQSFEDLEQAFKANNTNIQTTKKADAEQVPPEQGDNFSQGPGRPISDEEVLRQNGYTMRDVADQLINTQASILLQKNIAKGKVFIYTSKPKIIPVIKIITFILFLALMAMTIASYIVLMLNNAKLYYTYTTTGTDGSATTVETTLRFVSVFPYIPLIICLFIGFMAFSVIRNMQNDNAKFFMPWGWLSFFVFFIFVITMTSNESQILLFNRLGSFDAVFKKGSNIDTSGNWTASALEAIRLINIWKVFQYVTYGLLGGVIVCIISAAIFNPKRDIERIQQLLQQYAAEIRNGEIDTSTLGGGSPLGGFGSRIF